MYRVYRICWIWHTLQRVKDHQLSTIWHHFLYRQNWLLEVCLLLFFNPLSYHIYSVIIPCMDAASDKRNFMLIAQQLGMTTSDYVYLMPNLFSLGKYIVDHHVLLLIRWNTIMERYSGTVWWNGWVSKASVSTCIVGKQNCYNVIYLILSNG
jgi:hypothetical protein